MESQLTLVDAPGSVSSDGHVVLVFDKDDMRNTTLRVCGTDEPSYFVSTVDNVTTVRAGDGLLATITRRTFRPDLITFRGSKPTRLGSWLKAPVLCASPLQLCACGRRFKWREDFSGRLVLRESGRPGYTLAWFSKSYRDPRGHLHAAYLAIKPEMIEMKDMIVLSGILAEHKLRIDAAKQGKTMLDTMVLGF